MHPEDEERIEDAARIFFEYAISIWMNGSNVATPHTSLEMNFDLMRANLPDIALAEGSGAYVPLLREAADLAERQFLAGEEDAANKTMVHLLDLIQVHLDQPSEEEIQGWEAEGQAMRDRKLE